MNNYYCVLPFHSVETDFNNPNKNIYCCRLASRTDIDQVRASIANQSRSPACASCWQLEDQGMISERQIHNNTLDFLLDLNLDRIEQHSLTVGFEPKIIKLATSNLCNGQCVTCNSKWSSAWAALENQSTKYRGIDFEQLDHSIDWGKIVSLSFVGGEPLLEKKNFKILQMLIDLGNTNCFVSIVTNGSVELTEQQVDVLSKFQNVNICISIDGTGGVFDYMRFPLNWDRVVDNLKVFRQLTNNLSVSCMISNLNIYYYNDFVDFFKNHDLPYVCKQVNSPNMFNPGNLPDQIKDAVRHRNSRYLKEVNGFLELGKYSEYRYDQFKKELSRQDRLKNIQLSDYMPDVANLL
jgi:sulfatase maturation enzyme AslB (radical SAM superfamily)